MNKNVIIGIVLVAVVAIGAFLFSHSAPKSGGVQATTDITTSNFTTLASANGISNGGVYITAARISMTQGTTTPCAIQSPNATTSLQSASALFTVASSTTNVITIATSTNAFATTSLGVTANIASGAQGTINFAGTNASVLAPSTWVVVGMAGGLGGASLNVPVGVCTATFQVLQ